MLLLLDKNWFRTQLISNWIRSIGVTSADKCLQCLHFPAESVSAFYFTLFFSFPFYSLSLSLSGKFRVFFNWPEAGSKQPKGLRALALHKTISTLSSHE